MTQLTIDEIVPRRRLRRRTDPATSHDAAAQLTTRQSLCDQMLAQYRRIPSTNEEAALRAGQVPEKMTKRTADLKNAALIADTGVTRLGSSGRAQIVWRAVEL